MELAAVGWSEINSLPFKNSPFLPGGTVLKVGKNDISCPINYQIVNKKRLSCDLSVTRSVSVRPKQRLSYRHQKSVQIV